MDSGSREPALVAEGTELPLSVNGAKFRMNAVISMVKAWRLIFYQHALLAPALCQADGFTDDSPRVPDWEADL